MKSFIPSDILHNINNYLFNIELYPILKKMAKNLICFHVTNTYIRSYNNNPKLKKLSHNKLIKHMIYNAITHLNIIQTNNFILNLLKDINSGTVDLNCYNKFGFADR